MAVGSDLVRAEIIDAEEFQEVARRYAVGPVPKTLINYKSDFIGAAPESFVLEEVLTAPDL
jgi:hypothetical protein